MTFIYSFYFQNQRPYVRTEQKGKNRQPTRKSFYFIHLAYTTTTTQKKHENLLEEKISYAIFALRHKINKTEYNKKES